MAILLIIGIAVFASISSIVSNENIYKSDKNIFKAFTLKGRLIILLNIGIITLSIIQYKSNENIILRKERQATEEQQLRDSVLKGRYDIALANMKEKFDSSNLTVISTVSNVLGKYGYKLDSTKMALVELVRDSANNIVEEASPILKLFHKNGINLTKHENHTYNFEITMCSYDASSTGYNCSFYLVLEDSLKNLFFVKTFNFLNKTERITKDGTLSMYFNIPDNLLFNSFYIILKGDYFNLKKTKQFQVDDVYYYNLKGNTSGGIIGERKEKIEKTIKEHIKN